MLLQQFPFLRRERACLGEQILGQLDHAHMRKVGCRAQGGKGFRIATAKPAGQRNRQLRGKGRLPAQIGIHGLDGLDESVDGLGHHLLRTLLRHGNIRHVTVYGDHA